MERLNACITDTLWLSRSMLDGLVVQQLAYLGRSLPENPDPDVEWGPRFSSLSQRDLFPLSKLKVSFRLETL